MLFLMGKVLVVPCYGWGTSWLCHWSLFFLIYISDLVDKIRSEAKLFPDDTTSFTVVYDVDIAADELNEELDIIPNWSTSGRCRLILTKTNRPYRLSFPREKMRLSIRPYFSVGPKLLSKWSINILA